MKIAFLNAYLYEPIEDYQREYSPQMVDYLGACWPQAEVRVFECGLNEFPENEHFDLYVIGGSPRSAYEQDSWITHLISKTGEFINQNQKFLGICFGHQVIAEALGGKVEKAKNGWEIGVASFDVVENPLADQNASRKKSKTVKMYFSHQDQVVRIPDQAEVIASNDFCPVQAFKISNQVLSFQCHPEFDGDFLKSRIQARKDRLGEDVHNQALESLKLKPDTEWSIQFIRDFFSEF